MKRNFTLVQRVLTVIAWVMAITVFISITGCGKPAEQTGVKPKVPAGPAAKSPGDKIKIGFIVKQPEEPWFQTEQRFAAKAAQDYGFELIPLGAEDGEKVLAAIDNLYNNGAKGFVICTPDVRLGPAIKGRADKHGLKFMAVDDRFVKADETFMEDVHYLGMDPRGVGQLSGQLQFDEMKKRGWKIEETAACVSTFEELDTAKQRTDGAMEKLAELGFPKEKMYKAPNKSTDVPGSFEAANILLTKYPDVKNWLVVGMNDSAVLGPVRAMQNRGFSAQNIIGIGINGTDCIYEFEKAEPTGFYGSILLSPNEHGYKTAEFIYKWIKDGVEPPLFTKISKGTLITRDNYKQVYAEQGLELPKSVKQP